MPLQTKPILSHIIRPNQKLRLFRIVFLEPLPTINTQPAKTMKEQKH